MHITDLIVQYGYTIVFLITFFEVIAIAGYVVPGGNTFLILIGYLTTVTDLNIFACAVLAILGTILGNQVSYEIGRRSGKKLFSKENAVILSTKNKEKVERFFKKYGKLTLIMGRPIAVLRSIHALSAGTSLIPRSEFIKYNIIGGIGWVLGCLSIGWTIGMILKDKIPYESLQKGIDLSTTIFTISSLLIIFSVIIYKKFINKNNSLKKK